MKDFKTGCLAIFIWLIFSWFTTAYVYHSIEPAQFVIMVVLLLPTLSIMAYLLFFIAAPIVVLLYRLLTFPLKIFQNRKKETSFAATPLANEHPIYLYLPFVMSILLYTLAARLLNGQYPNPQWLPTLGVLGFIWGLILFFAVKKGILKEGELA